MSNAASFQPGDIVRLKSGGPSMTVQSVGNQLGTPTVYCVWFEGKKNEGAGFNPVTLEKVTNPSVSTGGPLA